jgi:hypothetical protein
MHTVRPSSPIRDFHFRYPVLSGYWVAFFRELRSYLGLSDAALFRGLGNAMDRREITDPSARFLTAVYGTPRTLEDSSKESKASSAAPET